MDADGGGGGGFHPDEPDEELADDEEPDDGPVGGRDDVGERAGADAVEKADDCNRSERAARW